MNYSKVLRPSYANLNKISPFHTVAHVLKHALRRARDIRF